MSYKDDEEFKEGILEDEEDLLLETALDDPFEDEVVGDDTEEDLHEGFAGLDGTEY
jgi:hypothetical protein